MKHLLFFILVLISLACQRKSSSEDILVACLKEPKFQDWYFICQKQMDTVYIYDNTNNFNTVKPINISCDKVLTVQISNINVNVNTYSKTNEDRIVLYKFETKRGVYKLYFLNILSNANMIIELNSKCKVTNYTTGIF